MMALTFMGLGALEVVAPPPYIFLFVGLFSPYSNFPLLMASSILVPQSHNSPKELIGDDNNLLLHARRNMKNKTKKKKKKYLGLPSLVCKRKKSSLNYIEERV